jgi:hypothetical protein
MRKRIRIRMRMWDAVDRKGEGRLRRAMRIVEAEAADKRTGYIAYATPRTLTGTCMHLFYFILFYFSGEDQKGEGLYFSVACILKRFCFKECCCCYFFYFLFFLVALPSPPRADCGGRVGRL